MGRTQPSLGAPPPSQRKDARAKKAKQTINRDIPLLLKAYPRAQAGIDASEIFTSHVQQPSDENSVTDKASSLATVKPLVSIQCADTLRVAQTLAAKELNKHSKKSRITILNMASPLRPGGGFLNGATSQEESLCMRTTLLPSLKEEFYRLPEVGGIFTPDVLVFRSSELDAIDLPKNERFFVNVITAAMHRMPDIKAGDDGTQHFANNQDRLAAEARIRAVLRVAKVKNTRKLVLGAWGCGAYGNPALEIAAAFERVLFQYAIENSEKSTTLTDDWSGMEIVFAIRDRILAQQFADIMNVQIDEEDVHSAQDSEADGENQDELSGKIKELESQISITRSDMLRQRLSDTLMKLKEGQRAQNDCDEDT